jgi:hypothetical protein
VTLRTPDHEETVRLVTFESLRFGGFAASLAGRHGTILRTEWGYPFSTTYGWGRARSTAFSDMLAYRIPGDR